MVPWYSDLSPISTKLTIIEKQSLSSAEPSRSGVSHDHVIVRIARQVTPKPSTKTSVMEKWRITRLLYWERARLGNQFQNLHFAPAIVEPARSKAFYIFVSNFQSKRVHLIELNSTPSSHIEQASNIKPQMHCQTSPQRERAAHHWKASS